MTNNNELLAVCPCGQIPVEIYISDAGQGGKWANATPSCCGQWMIEFRTDYNGLESDECRELAIEAWNAAPRRLHEG